MSETRCDCKKFVLTKKMKKITKKLHAQGNFLKKLLHLSIFNFRQLQKTPSAWNCFLLFLSMKIFFSCIQFWIQVGYKISFDFITLRSSNFSTSFWAWAKISFIWFNLQATGSFFCFDSSFGYSQIFYFRRKIFFI